MAEIQLDVPFLTPREAAGILHVHINTVRRWHRLGLLSAYRINSRGDRRFKSRDVHLLFSRLVASNGVSPKKTVRDVF